MFEHVEPFAGDPILSLNDAFKADTRPEKVNLSIGVYTDENGRIPVLGSVKASYERIGFAERPYLPMDGHPGYREGVQKLVFGDRHPARESKRIATIQTIGGTGAVGIAADFLAKHTPGRAVLVTDQQPGVVPADGGGTHQDRVAAGADLVDPVEIGVVGQQ